MKVLGVSVASLLTNEVNFGVKPSKFLLVEKSLKQDPNCMGFLGLANWFFTFKAILLASLTIERV